MWIEIFKVGKHRDHSGATSKFTRQDLEDIASRYDPTYHEAPVVIGHPKDNRPAFGWVEALKAEGNTLLAKLKDVVPEFLDLLKRGLFKKRSASFYRDLDGKGTYLRHIGFLGATPPAVKGLSDLSFKDRGQHMSFEFSDLANQPAAQKLEDKIRELMSNPPKLDRYGQDRRDPLSYGEAFEIVSKDNPELTAEYMEESGLSIHFTSITRG